jgi:hypothetical protein
VRRRCGAPASRSWRPRERSICFLIFNRSDRPCEPRASAQVWSSASGCSRTRAWPPSQGLAADGPRPSSRSAWRTSISTGRTSWLRPRHSVRTGRWTKSFSSATAPG